MIIFGIFIQARSVCLQKRGHLIDERAGSAGTDTVHPLFHIAAFKINDFGVFAAQFDCNVRNGSKFLKGSGNRDDFLYEGNL